jgi:hypothetical protein
MWQQRGFKPYPVCSESAKNHRKGAKSAEPTVRQETSG